MKMKKVETYKKIIACSNCDTFGNHQIPMGTTVLKYIRLKNLKCKYCGCGVREI